MAPQTRWGEIERSLNIFERNALELLQLLSGLETDQELQAVLLAQPGPDDATRRDYYQQLDQRISNFIASFAALIDHIRGAISFYKGTPLARSFDQRNSAVRDMQEARFLRRLRNMLLDRGSAPLGVRFRFPNGEVPRDATLSMTATLKPPLVPRQPGRRGVVGPRFICSGPRNRSRRDRRCRGPGRSRGDLESPRLPGIDRWWRYRGRRFSRLGGR